MKTKTFFKILAMGMILMLLAMTLGTYSYAAVTGSTTGTITVSELEAGVNVSIYRLTDVHIASNGQPESTPYTWVSQISDWVNTNYSSYSSVEDFADAVTTDSTEAKKFYSDLAAAIKGGEIADFTAIETKTVPGTASYPVTDPNKTVEFTDCAMGTYLILVENGYRVYSPAVVNLLPEFSGSEWVLNETTKSVELKSETPTITKTITDEAKKADNYSTKDTMTFTIVADVPNYLEDALAKNYYISDKFANGTIDTDSITVYGMKGSAPTELTAGNEYEITTEDAQRPTGKEKDVDFVDFLLDFDYDLIKGYDQIKVTYTATLNKDSSLEISEEGNKNKAYLDYSNNPYVTGSYQTQEDNDTTVYTYGVEVSKIDKTKATPLPGAEFNLLIGSDIQWFVKGAADGEYYLANQGDSHATQTLAVDSNGKLNIKGLDAGTYILKETKAPDGYNLKTEADTIVITDTNKDGKLDGQVGGQDVDPNGTGIYTITVENSKGFQLPVTGGIGTVVFAAAGIVVVGLGMTLLMIVFKKNRAAK